MGEEASHTGVPERAGLAAVAPRSRLEPFFGETVKEVLVTLARNPNLVERDLLRLLERKDLPQEALRELAGHTQAARSYRVKLALVRHPKTPRLISLPLLKFLHLFDLLGVSQTPAVPAEVKKVAEETILKKMEALPSGEKITLARRGSGRIAAGLLVTRDAELIHAALSNPYLSEGHLLKVLALNRLPPLLVEMISQHERWSRAYHLRLALIRNPLTPFARVLAFLPDISVNDLRDLCLDPGMPDQVRKYIIAHCAQRLNKKGSKPSKHCLKQE
jgi:hypothetical protein